MGYTMGSLFAGIGGFDLGFSRAGFDIYWQVEIDPFCRKVLAKHFPETERFDDIRSCGITNLKRVDVICGGFPCQDISNAGLRAGIEGERSGLWREMHRVVGELRPRVVVVENVAALLVRGIERVVGDLAEIGYDAEWEIVSAADVGAPHLRERVWIVAYPSKERRVELEIKEFPDQRGNETLPDFFKGNTAAFSADARQERIQGFESQAVSGIGGFSWCKDVRRVEDLRGRSDLPEPLIRGTSDGIPSALDTSGLVDYISQHGNREEVEMAETLATYGKDGRVRILRLYLQVAEASRRLAQTNAGASTLSAVSCQSRSPSQQMGEWKKEETTVQDLPCMVHAEGFPCPQNMWFQGLPIETGTVKRWLALENWQNRVGAIGNAVVPQIPEMYAHRIKEVLNASPVR